MNFAHLNRRTHLYLALFLLPWFLLYGVSSVPFSHHDYFEAIDKAQGLPLWTTRLDRTGFEAEVPPPGADLRPLGARIMAECGITGGSWGAYRVGPKQINVYIHRPFQSTQIKYFAEEKRLLAEDRRFRWDHFLTGMHAKGGFEQGGWHNAWGVVVDLVCLGMLLWIATGIYMWWHLKPQRALGWAALASGFASFAWFVTRL